MEYKDTLNILSSAFEMKANLNQKEPIIQQQWLNNQIYKKILKKNLTKKHKILHDGPPYANGSIHCGHALNKILKDIIVRYWNMSGCYSHFIPGWDTHGMPIEHALIKKGVNIDKNLSIKEKRDNCKKYASEQIEIQKKQFSRLGLVTDFIDTYKTFDNDFEYEQLLVFNNAVKKKLVYQDLKPVFWSCSSQTALADAEVEYSDEEAFSIYVGFNVASDYDVVKTNDILLIWTTTPWTIPANLAIAINPRLEYVKIKVNNKNIILASSRLETVAKLLNWKDYSILTKFPGKKLQDIKYVHPLYPKNGQVVLAEYVSITDGTGLVHCAPDFGEEDYLALKIYGIKPFHPIDHYGKFNEKINDHDLVGVFYEDANDIVLKKLATVNMLFNVSKIKHSVAHDWRTKKPIIYRSTKQWFIDISKLKTKILASLKKTKFPNDASRKQLVDMINNRSEWCISRQRYWGVPIPIIYDENDNPIMDNELISNIINILHKETTNVWFDKPVEYFLTPKYKNKNKYRKETDILDVWFDSGTTFNILKQYNIKLPVELYLEGKDQFRGWFNSSLINAIISINKAPYKTLLGCGFVLDGEGKKMSKSLGNVIDPNEICQKYGADVLRLWAANSDYSNDVRISTSILDQVAEIYRRIRNSLFKFILSNISDFDFTKNKSTKFNEIDLLVLNQLNINIKKIIDAYNQYNFITIVELINNHTLDLSSWYFSLIKDSLYCDDINNKRRRTIQTVLYHILNTYMLLLAPIMPHTCEEAYTIFNKPSKCESIFLGKLPKKISLGNSVINVDKWKQFMNIKNKVYAEIEINRQNKVINKTSEAICTISFNNKYNFSALDLSFYLNVAHVDITNTNNDEIKCLVKSVDDNYCRCERCWNYFAKSAITNGICARCNEVIKKRK